MPYKIHAISTSYSKKDPVAEEKLRKDMALSIGRIIMSRVSMPSEISPDGSIVYHVNIKFEDLEESRNSE